MKIIVAIFLYVLFFSKSVKCTPVYKFTNLQIDTIEQPYLMPWGGSEPEKPILNFAACTLYMEDKPRFPEGDKAMFYFLREHIKYPEEAIHYGIQGTVYVNFTVDITGAIVDVKLRRGISCGCDEEAIRVIKMMPNWIPGRQQEKPVPVNCMLPVKFHLK